MKVFLATPAYVGSVIPEFERSIIGSLRLLKEAGIPAHWEAFSGCCYLPVARNKLIRTFLESDMTDFVFLDADLEWDPDKLLELLSWPVEIVAGVYPHKGTEESYPVWYRTDEEHFPVIAGLSGLIECWSVSTGFMRITRSAFEAIKRHYGEALKIDEYAGDSSGSLTGSYLNFFDCEKIGRRWWGEDTNFCRRWTLEMGRPLYVQPDINFTHWGTSPGGLAVPFHGNFHEYLSRLPGGANDPGYHGNNIDGFMSLQELQWLFSRAREMKSIVEIGSFQGKSAHALLSACSGIVHCVDPWEPLYWNPGGDSPEQAEERYRRFLANTAEFPNRVAIRATSVEASREFGDASVDMVFIDGEHTFDAIMVDILAWLPKARRIICGHDYGYLGWPDVKRAVDEAFGDRVGTVGSIWYVELP